MLLPTFALSQTKIYSDLHIISFTTGTNMRVGPDVGLIFNDSYSVEAGALYESSHNGGMRYSLSVGKDFSLDDRDFKKKLRFFAGMGLGNYSMKDVPTGETSPYTGVKYTADSTVRGARPFVGVKFNMSAITFELKYTVWDFKGSRPDFQLTFIGVSIDDLVRSIGRNINDRKCNNIP